MKRKILIYSSIFFYVLTSFLMAQDRLSESSVWFSKALRSLFSEKINIHGVDYYLSRIPCSNIDITHFDVKSGLSDSGYGPALYIKGSLQLDALPRNLKVIDGAQGKKYMLLLQGYLFSPDGNLLWKQQGFAQNNSWVNISGSISQFVLINSFSGPLTGCTAVILAVGDPIIVEGNSETRIILGMKLISFQGNNESSTYIPTVSKNIISRYTSLEQEPKKQTSKSKYTNLQYLDKTVNGMKYKELISIPESEKKKIFYELVEYQDKTGDSSGAYKVLAGHHGLPIEAINAIASEGLAKYWPMP